MRQKTNESGMALIVSLGMLLIFSVMMIGLYFLVLGEQKLSVSNRVNTVAFYGAEAGLEKMSADLDSLSETTALTYNNITGLGGTSNTPTIPNVQYLTYSLTPQTNPPSSTTLAEIIGTIGGSGPLSGLQGIITPVTLTVVAQAVGVGGTSPEVKLSRQVHSVAVPVFEFGIFSQTDISFWAGANYAFGGRVGSNGNIFLAQAGGSILSLGDKVTSAQDIIRTQLPNGVSITSTFAGSVWVSQAAGGCPGALPLPGTPPANCRNLNYSPNEGSATAGPGSSYNNPPWHNLSLTTYNAYIRSSETGGKKLNLVIALGGNATPIAMIQRGLSTDTGVVPKERFYNKASLRILLSDSAGALTSLPNAATNDANSPYPLDSTIYAAPYNLAAATGCLPPIAQSPGTTDTDYFSPAGTSLLRGGTVNSTSSHSYIKMEIQLASSPGSWQDVTKEILGLGFSRDVGTTCTNNSILHLEEIRPDKTRGSTTASDYIPINMFDPREGNVRDTTSGGITFNGIMNIVELDVHNLQQWFAGNIGTNGSLAINTNMPGNGYTVYFSDRRSNYDASTDSHNTVVNNETGQYGNDDIINTSSTGTPNGTLDAAEDVNGNSFLDVYGATPQYSYTPNASFTTLFNNLNTASPAAKATVSYPIAATQGQKNGVIFFRRALRLVNGKLGNLPPLSSANCTYSSSSSSYQGGFTVVAENPIYVLGDYNADTSLGAGNQFNDVNPGTPSRCHVPAAVIGDALTVLSNNWSNAWGSTSWTSSGDGQSFTNSVSARTPTNTSYRMAVIAGKNLSFAHPSGWPVDLASTTGTDGGVHNFLRLLENWTGATTLNYKGSLVSFWYSVQATGIFKCCGGFFGGTVYNFPSRNDSFDVDFQNMSMLPPGTPRFTDVNALSFEQSLLPYQ